MVGNPSFKRRSMLKTISYSGAAAVAASGTASAASANGTNSEGSPPQRIEGPEVERELSGYRSRTAIEEVVETYATGVLEQLSEKDILNSASTDELPLDDVKPDRRTLHVNDNREGVGIDALNIDGEETPLITISANTQERDLTVYIQPNRDRAYAVTQDSDGRELFTTSGCDGWTYKETGCSACSCSYCRPRGWVKQCCCTKGAPGCCWEGYSTCYYVKDCCYCCD